MARYRVVIIGTGMSIPPEGIAGFATGVLPPEAHRAEFKLEQDDYRGGNAIQLSIVCRESV